MSKKINPSHDSHNTGVSPEEAIKEMGEEAAKVVQEHKENPTPENYFEYRKIMAKYKALVTGTEYKEPIKHHDSVMADIYTRYRQASNLNFYVGILSRFKRKCSWTMPTMQVGVSKSSYYLGYHPEWYKYITERQVLFVLQHEAHHILQEHIPRVIRMYAAITPADPKKPTAKEIREVEKLQTYTNIAADEAVNSMLMHNMSNRELKIESIVLPSDYDHEELLSYDQYLNSWLLEAQVLYSTKSDSKGTGSGHASMQQAMDQQGEGIGEGKGQGQPGSQGSGSGGSGSSSVPQSKDGGSQESTQDKVDRDYKDTTEGDGHNWIKDLQSGKALDDEGKGAPSSGGVSSEEAESLASQLSGLADNLAKQSQRALINTVREHNQTARGRGTVPGNYKEMYDELTAINSIPWTDMLANMISDPKESKDTFRINKLNRNNIFLAGCNAYGYKENDPTYHIWVSIDTSGSMSKEDVMEGIAVVESIRNAADDTKVTICEFDTSVQRTYVLEPGSVTDKEVWGRGGTDFDCVFTELSETPETYAPDLHIIFTDGGAPPPSPDCRIPTHKMPLLWVVTSQYPSNWFMDDNGSYGDILRVSDYK